MIKPFFSALMMLVPVSTAGAQQAMLKVGDPAPPLVSGAFVKGEPVTELEKDKVYVLEFWATWCGPCIAAMPHLTALQEKYADQGVVVIGQSVWEQDESAVKPFVAEIGEKMDYRVALDDKSNYPEGAMAATWMRAAGRDSIPCTFIVGRDGNILWIGHPMRIDQLLEQVVAGDMDIAAARVRAELDPKVEQLYQEFNKLMRADDIVGADAIAAELIALDPSMAVWVGMQKVQHYIYQEQRAIEEGEKMIQAARTHADGIMLNQLAWFMVGPDSLYPDAFDPALSLKIAEKANHLTGGNDPDILVTLARAQFVAGDMAKAAETQTKAIELTEDAEDKSKLAETLRKYQLQ